ncbi:hypothetical protein CCAX7_49790 [Capsulimonas corticalis]|uniref:Uncharacterized protein n=1 Tax=Capsulimonas corticalis TaxID=2219043 RepID=A0A402CPQ5_9BACT|nr:hypothetical protein [Capsulimonas corticalis]BDI32928.1 hypothetical protein CCAX7_49790 [Capsulimonas corticalis]
MTMLKPLCLSLLLSIALATPSRAQSPAWDTYSDTWVATDGLGRSLPTASEVGAPRANKTVGVFYFLTFDHSQATVYDNSKILKAHPEAMGDVHHPAWGPLNAAHYWGEPLFGYYTSDDEWVLRKHAQMLSNAGVDVVIFDNSNAVTYARARETLCRVWEQIRREGGKTPQIAFHCPFSNANGIGTDTLNELYETIYAPGRYSDLWLRWRGKPLIIADPGYADAGALSRPPQRRPAELTVGETLGQALTVSRPFLEVGGQFPTWAAAGSGMTLSLFADGPHVARLAQRSWADVKDNATLLIGTGKVLPPGKYYLEMSRPVGRIGWWGSFGGLSQSGAYENGEPVSGARSLRVRYAAAEEALPLDAPTTPAEAQERARRLRDFFTFRSPIAPYNLPKPAPGAWAWLQISPQAPQTDPEGKIEEVSVGVAQNYNATDNRTAPMSFPGAFGRSYHDAREETTPGAGRWGYNFDEQWRRARQIDPPFVFVTGWNEWTAGIYDDWAGFHAPPPIFVDEFNEEFSRDIEPMRGGHGDDYYYQLAANIRRYKGVRSLPAVSPHPIAMNGRFEQWKNVTPEFRDPIGDTAHRNAPGYGRQGPYVNATGRNDIIAAKVTYDAANIYFYVRTRTKLTPHTDADWMRLYLNTDANDRTGWLGYDFTVNGRIGDHTTRVERNVGGVNRWRVAAQARYAVQGNELEIAIPRSALGIQRLPAAIDFKWADHCRTQGDGTDFTQNGDAAPDDRFRYRAKFR